MTFEQVTFEQVTFEQGALTDPRCSHNTPALNNIQSTEHLRIKHSMNSEATNGYLLEVCH